MTERVEVDKLAVMSDSAIDHRDISSLNDAFSKNAVLNPFYKPTKTVANCACGFRHASVA